ncbi:MAG: hypothetical protein HFI36_01810 [Bacilli bacterium]|jgi:hypothetical protein|nr:hypothetical protein [Bacilli bacterium]
MMSLKDLFDKTKKEVVYEFYKKIVKNYKKYKSVTKAVMYNEILNSYYEDPEIILRMSSVEEISILKSLVFEEEIVKNDGYIEYLLFENLKKNFLIMEDDKFYIPEDLINYVKMAINVYDEKEYSWYDIIDSAIVGFVRIYNALSVTKMVELLNDYNTKFDVKSLKSYINSSLKFKNIVRIKRHLGKYYVVSLENLFYKDIIGFKLIFTKKNYRLEEIISIGKYKINLFKEPIFQFLSFLERYLQTESIDKIINKLVTYTGIEIHNTKELKAIAENDEVLYKEMLKVLPYFPVWLSKEDFDTFERIMKERNNIG